MLTADVGKLCQGLDLWVFQLGRFIVDTVRRNRRWKRHAVHLNQCFAELRITGSIEGRLLDGSEEGIESLDAAFMTSICRLSTMSTLVSHVVIDWAAVLLAHGLRWLGVICSVLVLVSTEVHAWPTLHLRVERCCESKLRDA